MGFETIATVVGKGKQASISYRRNQRSGIPRLIISIPKVIAADTIGVNDCFRLQLGTGGDKGKARLVRIKGGTPVCIQRGGVTLRFGFVPMLGNSAAEKEEIEIRPIDLGFEFDLPAWFKADED